VVFKFNKDFKSQWIIIQFNNRLVIKYACLKITRFNFYYKKYAKNHLWNSFVIWTYLTRNKYNRLPALKGKKQQKNTPQKYNTVGKVPKSNGKS